MVIEAPVFGGKKCVDEIGRQLLQGHIVAMIGAARRQDLALVVKKRHAGLAIGLIDRRLVEGARRDDEIGDDELIAPTIASATPAMNRRTKSHQMRRPNPIAAMQISDRRSYSSLDRSRPKSPVAGELAPSLLTSYAPFLILS